MARQRIGTVPNRWWPAVLVAMACAPRAAVAPKEAQPQPAPAPARPAGEVSPPLALAPTQRVARRPPIVLGPPADARAGFVANRVHPDNPIADVVVAGFSDQQTAVAFVAWSFVAREKPPVFEEKLARGQSVRFADAASASGPAFLVVYYFDERGRPTLLSLVKAHPDIPLAIGTIGYQFLLDVDRERAPREPLFDELR